MEEIKDFYTNEHRIVIDNVELRIRDSTNRSINNDRCKMIYHCCYLFCIIILMILVIIIIKLLNKDNINLVI